MQTIVLSIVALIGVAYTIYYFGSDRPRIVVSVYWACLKGGFSFKIAPMVMSQLRHETFDFTSDLFKRASNVSGMKMPKVRSSTGIIGESNSYAVYSGVWKSVQDYFLRQRSFEMPKRFNTLDEFIAWNKKSNYFEANPAEYLKGCERYYGGLDFWTFQIVDLIIFYVFIFVLVGWVFLIYHVIIWALNIKTKWKMYG